MAGEDWNLFRKTPREGKVGLYNAEDRLLSRMAVLFASIAAITPLFLLLIADWYPELKFLGLGSITSNPCPDFKVSFGWPATANCVEWPPITQCGIKFEKEELIKHFGGVPPDFPQIKAYRDKYSRFEPFPITALASLGGVIIGFWLLVAFAETYSKKKLEQPLNPLGFAVHFLALAAFGLNIVTVIYSAFYYRELSNGESGDAAEGTLALSIISLALLPFLYFLLFWALRHESLRRKESSKPKPAEKPPSFTFLEGKIGPPDHAKVAFAK